MFLYENWEISEVLDDIILGRGVKRSLHNLEYDQSIFTDLFISRLRLYKYTPMSLSQIDIPVGWRAPGFLIDGETAIFGYVFWEVFSDRHRRKIWASVVRNEKGDWKYILSENSSEVIFVNLTRLQEVDITHLS